MGNGCSFIIHEPSQPVLEMNGVPYILFVVGLGGFKAIFVPMVIKILYIFRGWGRGLISDVFTRD